MLIMVIKLALAEGNPKEKHLNLSCLHIIDPVMTLVLCSDFVSSKVRRVFCFFNSTSHSYAMLFKHGSLLIPYVLTNCFYTVLMILANH